MGLNAACRRKLQALQHPSVDTVDLSNETSFRTMIKWLENTKTRFYTEQDRKGLDATTADTWPSALEKYLQDLGAVDCNVQNSDASRVRVADWLLSYAIGMEYSDRADKLQKITKAPKTKPSPAPAPGGLRAKEEEEKKQSSSSSSSSNAPPAPERGAAAEGGAIELDADSPQFRKAVEQLADALALPHDDSSEAMLRAAATTLQHKLSASALAPPPTPPQGRGGAKRKPAGGGAFRLEDYPPGFDTGDAELNKAAALLRLLYVSDLRALQSQVNALIASMQDYTAHPKTDASLGKVGR